MVCVCVFVCVCVSLPSSIITATRVLVIYSIVDEQAGVILLNVCRSLCDSVKEVAFGLRSRLNIWSLLIASFHLLLLLLSPPPSFLSLPVSLSCIVLIDRSIQEYHLWPPH
jgi:hypothetical protein